jgi:hypothetical protein
MLSLSMNGTTKSHSNNMFTALNYISYEQNDDDDVPIFIHTVKTQWIENSSTELMNQFSMSAEGSMPTVITAFSQYLNPEEELQIRQRFQI